MKKFEITASLICADILNLEKEVREIEKANIEYIHFDMMDGVFVPRFGLFPEILSSIKKITKIPIDVHLMINDAKKYVPILAKSGADMIYVHAENDYHLHYTLKSIRENGSKSGVVLNLATPVSILDYILDDLDYIMLMGINPGIVGHKIIPKIYDKIKDVKEKIKDHPNIKIMIDGGVTPDTAAKMVSCGTDILVGGTSSIFRPHEGTLKENVDKFRKKVSNDLERGNFNV